MRYEKTNNSGIGFENLNRRFDVMEILEVVDKELKKKGLEIVMPEDVDADDYYFKIEKVKL